MTSLTQTILDVSEDEKSMTETGVISQMPSKEERDDSHLWWE